MYPYFYNKQQVIAELEDLKAALEGEKRCKEELSYKAKLMETLEIESKRPNTPRPVLNLVEEKEKQIKERKAKSLDGIGCLPFTLGVVALVTICIITAVKYGISGFDLLCHIGLYVMFCLPLFLILGSSSEKEKADGVKGKGGRS